MKREHEDKAVRNVETKEVVGPENCREKIAHRTRLGTVCPVCATAIPLGPFSAAEYTKYLLVAAPTTPATGEPVSDEERDALDEYNALMVERDALFSEKQRLDAQRVALMQPSVNYRGEIVYPPGAASLGRIAVLGEQIEELNLRAHKALVRWNAAGRRRMRRIAQGEVTEPARSQGGLRGAIDALLRA